MAFLAFFILFLCGCGTTRSKQNFFATVKNNAVSNGAWTVVRKEDKFDSFISSHVEATNDPNWRLVVQDNIYLVNRSAYICGGFHIVSILFEATSKQAQQELSRGFLVGKSKELLYLDDFGKNILEFIYALNERDSIAVKFVDECGKSNYLEFDTTGTSHYTVTLKNNETGSVSIR